MNVLFHSLIIRKYEWYLKNYRNGHVIYMHLHKPFIILLVYVLRHNFSEHNDALYNQSGKFEEIFGKKKSLGK